MMQGKAGAVVNIKNDPLLCNEKYWLISGEGTINIYRILSNYNKNAKSLTAYYHLDKDCAKSAVNLLLKKYGTAGKAADAMLERLEEYRKKGYSSKIKERWRVKSNLIGGNITLEYARVMSLILEIEGESSVSIFNRFLTNSRFFLGNRDREMKCPVKIDDLNNELAYLAGIVAGDGHIEKDLYELKIVDGHRDKILNRYSYRFLSHMDRIIRRNFNCVGSVEKTGGNYFVFRYCNSIICRIMNYIYEIPAGDKSRVVTIPKILKNTEKEHLFWRGIFDTDGSIRPKNKAISMVTASKQLHEDFLDFCKRNGIVLFAKKTRRICDVIIAEESIADFARIIGSSHPRKQKNLMGYLRTGASYTVPVKKKPDRGLGGIARYLRPYRGNIYIRLTTRRETVTKEETEERLNRIRGALDCRIVEVKAPRRNNHYYICSKQLLDRLNDHYEYKLTWEPFPKKEIEQLKQRWDNHE